MSASANGGNANNTRPVGNYLTINQSGQIESSLPIKVDGDISSTSDISAVNGTFTGNVTVDGDIIGVDTYVVGQEIITPGPTPTTTLPLYVDYHSAMKLPSGTSAQRPSSGDLLASDFRYNTDLTALEYYTGSAWETVTSSADLSAIQYQSASGSQTRWDGSMQMTQLASTANHFALLNQAGNSYVDIVPSSDGITGHPSVIVHDSSGNQCQITSTQLSGPSLQTTTAEISGTSASLVAKDNGGTNIVYINPNVPTPLIVNGNINASSFITSNSSASVVFETKDVGGGITSSISNAGDFTCNSLLLNGSDAQITNAGACSVTSIQANSGSLLGVLNMNSNKITNLADGASSGDAVNYGQLTSVSGNYLQKANNLSDLTSSSTARTNLGVTIGTNVEAWSATLDAVSAGTYTGSSSITTLGTVASGVWNGTKVGLLYGGTNADLSSSGGTSQVLKQTSVGGNISVAQLAASDLSNGTSGSGSVALTTSPSFTTPVLGTPTSGTLTNCTSLPASSLTGQVAVTNGGTGDASFTAYAPICGGTTTTGVLQSASTGISSSGYVLTSNGSSSIPSFQALPAGTNYFNTTDSRSYSINGGYVLPSTQIASAAANGSPPNGEKLIMRISSSGYAIAVMDDGNFTTKFYTFTVSGGAWSVVNSYTSNSGYNVISASVSGNNAIIMSISGATAKFEWWTITSGGVATYQSTPLTYSGTSPSTLGSYPIIKTIDSNNALAIFQIYDSGANSVLCYLYELYSTTTWRQISADQVTQTAATAKYVNLSISPNFVYGSTFTGSTATITTFLISGSAGSRTSPAKGSPTQTITLTNGTPSGSNYTSAVPIPDGSDGTYFYLHLGCSSTSIGGGLYSYSWNGSTFSSVGSYLYPTSGANLGPLGYDYSPEGIWAQGYNCLSAITKGTSPQTIATIGLTKGSGTLSYSLLTNVSLPTTTSYMNPASFSGGGSAEYLCLFYKPSSGTAYYNFYTRQSAGSNNVSYQESASTNIEVGAAQAFRLADNCAFRIPVLTLTQVNTLAASGPWETGILYYNSTDNHLYIVTGSGPTVIV